MNLFVDSSMLGADLQTNYNAPPRGWVAAQSLDYPEEQED